MVHHHLGPVNKLRHFFGQFLIGLVFRRNPDFTGFFNDFLADEMGALV